MCKFCCLIKCLLTRERSDARSVSFLCNQLDVSRFILCCFIQRYVHDPDKLPSSVKDIFTQHCQIYSHETRKRYDLPAAPMNTKTYGCKKVSYLARSCWNPLPSEIKSIKLVKPFKESLKSHILSEY